MRETLERDGSVIKGPFERVPNDVLQDDTYFHYADNVMADVDTLGITTREELVAYFHYRHRWPKEFIAQELGMPEDEVRQQIGAGKQQLLRILGIKKDP